jgi:hypothetical protein
MYSRQFSVLGYAVEDASRESSGVGVIAGGGVMRDVIGVTGCDGDVVGCGGTWGGGDVGWRDGDGGVVGVESAAGGLGGEFT